MTRTGTFIFAPGKQSGNFLARVQTGGGGFLNELGEAFTVLPGDVLVKLAHDDGPWFALFRDPVVVGKTPEPATEPEPATTGVSGEVSAPAPEPGDQAPAPEAAASDSTPEPDAGAPAREASAASDEPAPEATSETDAPEPQRHQLETTAG